VEGDDIGQGTVDVVVTEGFSGNIALKTAEGTAKQIAGYLRAAMNRTWMARIGYLFAKGAFDALRDKLDPRKVNGGVFLGLDGIVVKSHGGTDPEGFAAAIDLAYDMVKYELLSKIRETLAATFPHGGAMPEPALPGQPLPETGRRRSQTLPEPDPVRDRPSPGQNSPDTPLPHKSVAGARAMSRLRSVVVGCGHYLPKARSRQ
jgi:hypothetical protein